MKTLHLILPLMVLGSTVIAIGSPIPSEPIPKQLGGKIVDSKGKTLSETDLGTYDYFLFYVSADFCAACKPMTREIIDFYNRTAQKKVKVAFILIGRDLEKESHTEYLKKNEFPFFTSYWKDLVPLRTHFRAFWYWRGGAPYFYLLKKDGSCILSQYDWKTEKAASPGETLNSIKEWISRLPNADCRSTLHYEKSMAISRAEAKK